MENYEYEQLKGVNIDNLAEENGLSNELPLGILRIDWNKSLISDTVIWHPLAAVRCLVKEVTDLTDEAFYAIYSDCDNRPICASLIATGNENNVPVDIKKITQLALLTNASHVTVLHNHPDCRPKRGSLKPSHDDVVLTKDIAKALNMFGIKLTDHIIVNGYWNDKKQFCPAYYSMRDHGAFGVKGINNLPSNDKSIKTFNERLSKALTKEKDLTWDEKYKIDSSTLSMRYYDESTGEYKVKRIEIGKKNTDADKDNCIYEKNFTDGVMGNYDSDKADMEKAIATDIGKYDIKEAENKQKEGFIDDIYSKE